MTTTMTTTEVANRLVEICRTGDFTKAQKELFADDATSIEPYATPDFKKETKGLDAILAKGEKWDEMVEELQSIRVSDPLVASESFACTMRMQVDIKDKGVMDMMELCVYRVKDGKIISEEFFV